MHTKNINENHSMVKDKTNSNLKNDSKISKTEKENEKLVNVANKILTKHEKAFKELA